MYVYLRYRLILEYDFKSTGEKQTIFIPHQMNKSAGSQKYKTIKLISFSIG